MALESMSERVKTLKSRVYCLQALSNDTDVLYLYGRVAARLLRQHTKRLTAEDSAVRARWPSVPAADRLLG